MNWKTRVADDFTLGNPSSEIEFPEYWDVLVQYFENIQSSTNLTKVIPPIDYGSEEEEQDDDDK
jgi:hypothetical protein